jgi:hypothetical protein
MAVRSSWRDEFSPEGASDTSDNKGGSHWGVFKLLLFRFALYLPDRLKLAGSLKRAMNCSKTEEIFAKLSSSIGRPLNRC